MTDPFDPAYRPPQEQIPPWAYGEPPPASGPGPAGKVRPTGVSMVLFFVTLGIYGYVWIFCVHNEMKRHSGGGLGGGVALLLYALVGVASPFLASAEVGELYQRIGRPKPVSGMTGFWMYPGILVLVGPFIWFVKTNNALNDYWTGKASAG